MFFCATSGVLSQKKKAPNILFILADDLDVDLFNSGVRPAINSGLSVSRVGGAAQTKIMKKLGGKINIISHEGKGTQVMVMLPAA